MKKLELRNGKLKLNRETLRILEQSELLNVAGGFTLKSCDSDNPLFNTCLC